MKATITALTAAAAIMVGSAAVAQTVVMNQGFNMLSAALFNEFERMGIPTAALDDLTLGQIATIKQIIDSDENEGQKKGRIEAVIANN